MGEQEPQEQRIQFELPVEVATGVYANYALVHHSTEHEITIDFCQLSTMPPTPEGIATARIVARIHIAPTFVTPLLKAISENAFRQEDTISRFQKEKKNKMSEMIKTESTPTRIERESSIPRSTRPGEEVNRIWPRPEHVASCWDVSVSQSPPQNAPLNVVMTFGGGVVRMEAVDIGVSAEGREAPNVYGRLMDAVRTYLEASGGKRAELLNYAPDTWFKFVPPNQAHRETLTERFNEAYDEEAKREDEEFVKRVKKYHRSRFSDEW